jgi:uncharacterized protein YjbJ (UPF0337 family)
VHQRECPLRRGLPPHAPFTATRLESTADEATPLRHLSPSIEVAVMNEDTIKGQWKQLGGSIKQKWGKLTDNDLTVAEGNADYLAGKVQERYGIARDEAEAQVREFQKTLRH